MPPRVVLVLWPAIDALLRAVYHIKPLRSDGGGIICLQIGRYRGPTRVLHDGSEVRTGDTIVELHLNNTWFRSRRRLNLTASRSSSEFLVCFAQDLRLLARRIASGALGDVVALHGSSLLSVVARRLGFQVDEVPESFSARCACFYMTGLMRTYHLRSEGEQRCGDKAWHLKEIWLSRVSLLSKYGAEGS
jgi:peptidoglycan-N-acetylglucosamine deacetylase